MTKQKISANISVFLHFLHFEKLSVIFSNLVLKTRAFPDLLFLFSSIQMYDESLKTFQSQIIKQKLSFMWNQTIDSHKTTRMIYDWSKGSFKQLHFRKLNISMSRLRFQPKKETAER